MPRPTVARTLSVSLLLFLLAAAGCARWGGAVLEDNHVAFNSSVAEAMDRQMLLNIVRMSQHRSTQWMTVSLINVQSTVSAGASGNVVMPSGGSSTGTAAGIATFNYTPNITFVPQQGERLARELMSPIPVSTLERLVSAGWPASLVMLLCAEKAGTVQGFDVTNDRGIVIASGGFGRFLNLVRELSEQHLVSLSQVPQLITWNVEPIAPADVTLDRVIAASKDSAAFSKRDDGNYDYRTVQRVPVLTLYEGIEAIPQAAELSQMLGFEARPGSYRMVASEDIWPGETVSLRTRSFMATLQLLAMGVDLRPAAPEPPFNVNSEAELYERMSTATENQDLRPFVSAVFRVRCSEGRPTNALISVHDGRYWYWIDRDDSTSRTIFAMVRDMHDLQVTGDGQASPILTLPVGR